MAWQVVWLATSEVALASSLLRSLRQSTRWVASKVWGVACLHRAVWLHRCSLVMALNSRKLAVHGLKLPVK